MTSIITSDARVHVSNGISSLALYDTDKSLTQAMIFNKRI